MKLSECVRIFISLLISKKTHEIPIFRAFSMFTYISLKISYCELDSLLRHCDVAATITNKSKQNDACLKTICPNIFKDFKLK